MNQRAKEELEKITVSVDVVPGPYTEMIAERMCQVLVQALLDIGAEVTAVRIELLGDMASW